MAKKAESDPHRLVASRQISWSPMPPGVSRISTVKSLHRELPNVPFLLRETVQMAEYLWLARG
jgi:hypothetical protein